MLHFIFSLFGEILSSHSLFRWQWTFVMSIGIPSPFQLNAEALQQRLVAYHPSWKTEILFERPAKMFPLESKAKQKIYEN